MSLLCVKIFFILWGEQFQKKYVQVVCKKIKSICLVLAFFVILVFDNMKWKKRFIKKNSVYLKKKKNNW